MSDAEHAGWAAKIFCYSRKASEWQDHGLLLGHVKDIDDLGKIPELRLEVKVTAIETSDAPTVRATVSITDEDTEQRVQRLKTYMEEKGKMLKCEEDGINILEFGGENNKITWAVLQRCSNSLKRARASEAELGFPSPPLPPTLRTPETQLQVAQPIEPVQTYALSEVELTSAQHGTSIAQPKPPVELLFPQPGRPGYGQRGHPIKVRTNYAPIVHRGGKELVVHHYDMKWDFAREGIRKEPLEASLLKMKSSERSDVLPWVWLQKTLFLLCDGCSPVHDGHKILYASEEMRVTEKASQAGWSQVQNKLVITISGCGRNRSQDWILTLTKTAHTMSLGELFGDAASRGVSSSVVREQQRDKMSVLDIIMRHDAFLQYRQVGDAFFDLTRRAIWADSKSLGPGSLSALCFGYRQSIVMTDRGPMMQQDRAGAVLTEEKDLIDFIADTLRKRSKRDLTIADFNDTRNTALFAKKKWKVLVKHNKCQYTMVGIDNTPISKRMFEDKEIGQTISIADYFKRKYPKFTLEYAHLPGVLAGTKAEPMRVILPLELCFFSAGNPTNERSPKISETMIREMCLKPPQRFAALDKISRGTRENLACANTFGLELQEPSPANARILEPCCVFYKDQNGHETSAKMEAGKAQWNLRGQRGGDMAFQEVSGGERRLGAVNFGSQRNFRLCDKFDEFMNAFVDMAWHRGIYFSGDPIQNGEREQNKAGELLERLFIGAYSRKPDLVVCLLPGSQSENARVLYPSIKRWSATSGIPTQCVQGAKLIGRPGAANPQYIAGILLKVNLKLGGKNGFVGLNGQRSGLPVMTSAPTIVFGADVHHAAPNSTQPSYAAIVASLDKTCTKFHTVVNRQGSRNETLFELEASVTECLLEFEKENGTLPSQIFFLRDGVAHNQFGTSRDGGLGPVQQEIQQLLNACSKVCTGVAPKLVYVVVQKKTRCRLAFSRNGSSDIDNVPPGTIVDSNITEASAYDFYMVPHCSIMKGTCQPSHFHVVYDDLKLSPDDLQAFMYQLCHAYGRATKVVSRPAPVYYAHLAAFHASFYNVKYKADAEVYGAWGETASVTSGSHATTQTAAADIQVAPNLKNILHYV